MGTVRDPSPAWHEQEELRKVCRVMFYGTKRLFDERIHWLPPEFDEGMIPVGNETLSEYDQRISHTVVDPYFRRAVIRAAAALFARPIVAKDDVPAFIRPWLENIDLAGNDINAFLYRYPVLDGIREAGFGVVLVDHEPLADQTVEVTTEVLAASGKRPYWVHIPAANILDAVPETVGGRVRLAELRILVPVVERTDAWTHETVETVRVLRPAPVDAEGESVGFAGWVEYRSTKNPNDGKTEWIPGREGTFAPHTDIPARICYFNEDGFWRGRPPFEDLAWLNMQYTREWSSLGESLGVSMGAQLHRSGVKYDDVKKQRSIGAKRILVSEPADARAEWLERSGSAAQVGLMRMKLIEESMIRLSNEVHARRTGVETATGRVIDSSQAKSEIQAWVLALTDFIEELLIVTAKYRGQDKGGGVSLPQPFRWSDRSIETVRLLLDAHTTTGFPPLEWIAEEMQAQAMLSDDLDVANRAKEIAAAKVAAAQQVQANMQQQGSEPEDDRAGIRDRE